VKRIATALFVLSFVASPARADGVKAVVGTLGMASISSILCLFTVIYGPDDAESSNEDFDRRGFFLGVGGGFAGEDFSDKPVNDIADIFSNQPELDVPILPGSDPIAKADDSWSVNGRVGYRCHPRYSVGATLEGFGGFDTQWSGAVGTGSDDIDIFDATVDIKGYLLTGRYQPYLLLGGGTMNISTKVTNPTAIIGTTPNGAPPPDNLAILGPKIQSRNYTDFVVRLGGGIDLYTTDHVVVNIGASYLFPLGEVSGVKLFTVGGGIEYRF
jgi:hypothetical protein